MDLYPFSDERALNDIEFSYICIMRVETNNMGLQLITGFAQCAEDKEVREYLLKGKALAKKQIKIFEEILLKSDVQFSATSGSTVTESKMAPFSQKLMMFCTYLLNGFGLVGSSFGTIFSLRNDVSMKTALIAKDIFFYANDGIKLMIQNGWFVKRLKWKMSSVNKGLKAFHFISLPKAKFTGN